MLGPWFRYSPKDHQGLMRSANEGRCCIQCHGEAMMTAALNNRDDDRSMKTIVLEHCSAFACGFPWRVIHDKAT